MTVYPRAYGEPNATVRSRDPVEASQVWGFDDSLPIAEALDRLMAAQRMGTDIDYSGRPIIRPKLTDRPPAGHRLRILRIRHTIDGIRVTKVGDTWYSVDENLDLGDPVDDPKFD